MQILIPGDKLADAHLHLPGTITEGEATYAAVIGFFDSENKTFIPLEDLWYPRTGETVVGIIEGKHSSTYTVDLTAPYKGAIMAKYERTRFATGDIVESTVREFKQFDDAMIVMLTRPRKLSGGFLLSVKPSKIPRIIGRGDTMIRQITELTGSSIVVGSNGTIWVKDGDTSLASTAIKTIESEAHMTGLTDRIRKMLEDATGKKVEIRKSDTNAKTTTD